MHLYYSVSYKLTDYQQLIPFYQLILLRLVMSHPRKHSDHISSETTCKLCCLITATLLLM